MTCMTCKWWSYCNGTECFEDGGGGQCINHETDAIELMEMCPHCGYANTVFQSPDGVTVSYSTCVHFAGVEGEVFYWKEVS